MTLTNILEFIETMPGLFAIYIMLLYALWKAVRGSLFEQVVGTMIIVFAMYYQMQSALIQLNDKKILQMKVKHIETILKENNLTFSPDTNFKENLQTQIMLGDAFKAMNFFSRETK